MALWRQQCQPRRAYGVVEARVAAHAQGLHAQLTAQRAQRVEINIAVTTVAIDVDHQRRLLQQLRRLLYLLA